MGRQGWHGDFYPEIHVLANMLVLIETSSKVAAGPLASGDPQVTLSHMECLPQALALDPGGPLVTLYISLY
jgi:hypothetical protein